MHDLDHDGGSECAVHSSLRRTLPVALVVVVMVGLGACSSGRSSSKATPTTTATTATPTTEAPWPAPPDPMARARAAGLVPETAERLEHHVHSHLDVFVNGSTIRVPGGIGIDTKNPGVHSGTVLGQPAFGGISVPCDKPCISPLHTHDVSGILHTESATDVDNTLGQFFTEWAVTLSPTCVGTYCRPQTPIAIYVDGQRFTGDPARSR